MSERFFVDGRGIGLEDLRGRIHKHLGSDVVIEPSSYNVRGSVLTAESSTDTSQRTHGYVLSATRPQTLVSPALKPGSDFSYNSLRSPLGTLLDNPLLSLWCIVAISRVSWFQQNLHRTKTSLRRAERYITATASDHHWLFEDFHRMLFERQ